MGLDRSRIGQFVGDNLKTKIIPLVNEDHIFPSAVVGFLSPHIISVVLIFRNRITIIISSNKTGKEDAAIFRIFECVPCLANFPIWIAKINNP